MADQKLSALDSIPAIDRTADLLYVVDNSAGTSNKVTPNSLLGITGDPVGHSDSQTLSNKTLGNSNVLTLRDDRFTLQDSGDVTRQATFQLSGITAGQTRVMTLPDYNGTLATLAGTESLTNKTLPSAVLDQATITRPTLQTDTIAEYTAATGVTIDGLLIKDGLLPAGNIQPLNLVSGTGSSWVWQSWTPTLSGRFDDADWTKDCKFIQIGKTVVCRFRLAATAAAPMGGGTTDAIFTLPVTSVAVTTADVIQLGGASLFDSGTAVFPGYFVQNSTTVAKVKYLVQATAAYGAITSTAPFTWTTNDEIVGTFIYEAA